MYINDYVTIDLETTGLSPKYEKIIELGAAKIRDGKVIDVFSAFINPGKTLPERIIDLTGIKESDVSQAPYIEGVLEQFLDFLGEDVLLGHNLVFDYSFVKKAAVNQKLVFDKQGIDTLKISRRFLTDLESRKLEFLCQHYGIKLDAHRALNDAIATHELYQKLASEYYDKEKDLFQPKKLIYNVKKEGPITKKQYEQIIRLADRYELDINLSEDKVYMAPVENISEDFIDVWRLTKNEASRLIDRLLAKFGR